MQLKYKYLSKINITIIFSKLIYRTFSEDCQLVVFNDVYYFATRHKIILAMGYYHCRRS